MLCEKCGMKMVFELDLSGGCQGHAPDEYCYCPVPDAAVVVSCVNSKCRRRYRAVRLSGLSDRNLIATWIGERYENLP